MLQPQDTQEALQHLNTVGDFLRWCESQLRQHQVFLGHGTDNYNDEALNLVLSALHLPWDTHERVLAAQLVPTEKQRIVEWLSLRINNRTPLPYLTKQAWFCGLPFYVDERVLIPRSPLHEVVEAQFAPWLLDYAAPLKAMDLCTGSGCIAIAMAYALPNASVDAVDISDDALAVAEINIAKHQMQDRVRALKSDGLSATAQDYDIILCNPPYVDAEEMAALPDEYRHEPELALASGEDGLNFTRELLAQAADHLAPGGLLFVEVGYSWPAVERAWPEVPFLWLEFEHGGEGAFMLTREQLIEYNHCF